MTIEIDQSGKMEKTNKDTIIAFSNHKSKAILVSAKDKRIIQRTGISIFPPISA